MKKSFVGSDEQLKFLFHSQQSFVSFQEKLSCLFVPLSNNLSFSSKEKFLTMQSNCSKQEKLVIRF